MSDELDDIEALAAEYVLGSLDATERERADRLLARDPAFARLVEDWTERLTPIAEAIPPVEPPPQIWEGIQAALQDRRDWSADLAGRPSPLEAIKQPLLERLGFWRWCTVGASAVAAALALYIGIAPVIAPPEAGGRYVAVLSEGAASPAWLVTVDLAEKQLTIRPVSEVAVADRSLELWLVEGGDQPPRSLGLLDPQQPVAVPVSATLEAEVPRAAALAVSLEPLGGSPTGLPTGPVLYQGAILPISD